MSDLSFYLTDTGDLVLASSKKPPPPVFPNRIYVQCTSDSRSVSAVSLTVPSLNAQNAKKLAAALRKAAAALESKEVLEQAGTQGDKGVKIDLSSVMIGK